MSSYRYDSWKPASSTRATAGTSEQDEIETVSDDSEEKVISSTGGTAGGSTSIGSVSEVKPSSSAVASAGSNWSSSAYEEKPWSSAIATAESVSADEDGWTEEEEAKARRK